MHYKEINSWIYRHYLLYIGLSTVYYFYRIFNKYLIILKLKIYLSEF